MALVPFTCPPLVDLQGKPSARGEKYSPQSPSFTICRTEEKAGGPHPQEEEQIGLRPERLQLEWISAAESIRFAETMRRMEALRQSVTAEEIAETQNILSKL